MPIKLFRRFRADRYSVLKAATILGTLPIFAISAIRISAQEALTRSNGSSLTLPLPSGNEALPDAPSASTESVTILGTPKRFVLDELHFLQFPRYVNKSDLRWLLPLTGAAVACFPTDEKTMSEVVSSNPSFNQTSRNVSDGLRDGFIAVPVSMVGIGQLAHNEHARETGILGSEAMGDAYVIGELIKVASFRERPYTDRSEGSFYRTSAGLDSSFVSGHALTAWSSAAVLASEYPNRFAQIGIYTLATGVSLTRVLGQEHFPADVLLGSAAGWLIGHYVYRAHHRFRNIH